VATLIGAFVFLFGVGGRHLLDRLKDGFE
jgi:hypothetical protein